MKCIQVPAQQAVFRGFSQAWAPTAHTSARDQPPARGGLCQHLPGRRVVERKELQPVPPGSESRPGHPQLCHRRPRRSLLVLSIFSCSVRLYASLGDGPGTKPIEARPTDSCLLLNVGPAGGAPRESKSLLPLCVNLACALQGVSLHPVLRVAGTPAALPAPAALRGCLSAPCPGGRRF